MIDKLLPSHLVVVEETFGDDTWPEGGLFREERAVVARAVEKRRQEFLGVRLCARRAMTKLGVLPQPVLPGECGAPRWPVGLVGSMTHCDGYRAAALARTREVASLGIDAEPHALLPGGVLDTVSLPSERHRLARLAAQHPSVHWDRLLFSVKESVYKSWFPLTKRWLDFDEADIVITPADSAATHGHVHASLLVSGPLVDGRRLQHFRGRWIIDQGVLASAILLIGADDSVAMPGVGRPD